MWLEQHESICMTQSLKPTTQPKFGFLVIGDLLPERPILIGEFSPSYDAFRGDIMADLAPANGYEHVLALQIVDLNWAIFQAKNSSEVELAAGVENELRRRLARNLGLGGGDEHYQELQDVLRRLEGGDGSDEHEEIDAALERVDDIIDGLKSKDGGARGRAVEVALELGVDPRLVLSSELLRNHDHRRHAERLAELERRLRQLSAEYREVQRSRPVDVTPELGALR